MNGENIKIGDFGTAKFGIGIKQSFCGTLLIMAPELLAYQTGSMNNDF